VGDLKFYQHKYYYMILILMGLGLIAWDYKLRFSSRKPFTFWYADSVAWL